MAKKRIGIDALFQTSIPQAVPAPAAATTEVPVDRLAPNPDQPRRHFDAAALDELTRSVRAHGVLQPILVGPASADGTHEIVAGERRWRAARAAGLATVPVRVLELGEGDRLAVAMVENLQREDLNPLEEAEGYVELLRARLENDPAFAPYAADGAHEGVVRLLRALNNRAAGNTKDNVVLTLEPAVAEVFDKVGRITWRSFVAHRLPLLTMPEDVKVAVRAGLPYTKARAIARLSAERLGGDAARARRVRRDLVEQATTEGVSVRALQAEIARILGEGTAPPASGERDGELAARLAELRARIAEVDAGGYDAERRRAIADAVDALLELL